MFKYIFWKINRFIQESTLLDKFACLLFILFIIVYSLNYVNNQKISSLNDALLKAKLIASNPGTSSGNNEEIFLSKLIVTSEKEKTLYSLMSLASINDIEVLQANYQADKNSGDVLQIFHINLSCHASFERARFFIYKALKNNPYLSLDEIRLSRIHTNDDLLDIHLVFTMYLKNEK